MRNSTIVAVLVVLFLILGGWYWWSMNGGPAMPGVTPAATVPAEEGVFCTMDAMQCPDGSWVGRTGPNCEFVCPTSAQQSVRIQGGASSSVQTGTAADDQGIGDASVPPAR